MCAHGYFCAVKVLEEGIFHRWQDCRLTFFDSERAPNLFSILVDLELCYHKPKDFVGLGSDRSFPIGLLFCS